MSNILRYKQYTGQYEYDDDAKIFHGEIMNIYDVVTFQGRSVSELKMALKGSIEEYIVVCKQIGKSIHLDAQ